MKLKNDGEVDGLELTEKQKKERGNKQLLAISVVCFLMFLLILWHFLGIDAVFGLLGFAFLIVAVTAFVSIFDES